MLAHGLRAAGRELGRVADALPGGRRGRRPPPAVASGRRGIGQSAEGICAGYDRAANRTAVDRHDRVRGGRTCVGDGGTRDDYRQRGQHCAGSGGETLAAPRLGDLDAHLSTPFGAAEVASPTVPALVGGRTGRRTGPMTGQYTGLADR